MRRLSWSRSDGDPRRAADRGPFSELPGAAAVRLSAGDTERRIRAADAPGCRQPHGRGHRRHYSLRGVAPDALTSCRIAADKVSCDHNSSSFLFLMETY